MALRINRNANPPGTVTCGQESTTIASACHEYRLLVGADSRPLVTTAVVEFVNENNELDYSAVKQLFDHIWQQVNTDQNSNLVLDLSQVRGVDPRFKRELAYLARQLRQQHRFVRMSDVSLKGDWESWL